MHITDAYLIPVHFHLLNYRHGCRIKTIIISHREGQCGSPVWVFLSAIMCYLDTTAGSKLHLR